MESIRFETSTPSSGSDSIVDTSVIIFASLSLRKLVAVLINVLHNSPISRRGYFQYSYIVYGYILLAVTFFFLFSSFYFSTTNYTAIFIIQSTKKRVPEVYACMCVCVLSSASYKFNLKNLVLNYALADGIFHREIDFTPVVSGFITRTPFRRILPSPQLRNSSKVSFEKGYILTFIFSKRSSSSAAPPPEIPTRRKVPARPN